MAKKFTEADRQRARSEWDAWRNDREKYDQEFASRKAAEPKHKEERRERDNPLFDAKRLAAEKEYEKFRRQQEEQRERDNPLLAAKRRSAEKEWEEFRRQRNHQKGAARENREEHDRAQPTKQPVDSIKSRKDAYVVLGVSGNPSRREIVQAYRKNVLIWHPDRMNGRTTQSIAFATERMKLINSAREFLLRA